MKIAVPKEVKNNENRVGLSPDSVSFLIKQGHQLFIESKAGLGIGFSDDDYLKSGAIIIKDKNSLYEQANLIVKVKEPLPEEFPFFNESHTLFTYLHLAADMKNAKNLAKTGVTGIAYETITSDSGAMPLLAPMSNIAGQISILVGSYFLLRPNNGLGVMLGNFEGIDRRIVTVIGAGVAGTEAIKKALINNAHVKVIDLSKVITRDMLSVMKEGSVIVDISIDQGGCIETSQPTTHDDPVFIKDGVVHYCVTNMPGAVPLTATLALNKATLPYISRLAKDIKQTLNEDKHFRAGLSLNDGKIVHPALL